jgi:hypothetical protein
MPSRSNTARSTLTPPPITALRSSRMPSMRSLSALPAFSRRSSSQSRPSRVTRPGSAAGRGQHVADRADGAGGAVGHVPLVAGVAGERVVEHGLGRHLGGAEGGGGELAFAEVFHRPGDAAHAVRLHALGHQGLADDHFGGAPADVDHQPAFAVGGVGVRQHVRHALVDQAGFFAPRDHVDAEAQDGARAQQEFFAVARFAQRLRGHGAHLRALEAGQPLAEAGEGVPAALHGLGREVAGAVQAVALAHGFLEVFGAVDLAVVDLSDFEPEAVRAQVDCCEAGAVLHVVVVKKAGVVFWS